MTGFPSASAPGRSKVLYVASELLTMDARGLVSRAAINESALCLAVKEDGSTEGNVMHAHATSPLAPRTSPPAHAWWNVILLSAELNLLDFDDAVLDLKPGIAETGARSLDDGRASLVQTSPSMAPRAVLDLQRGIEGSMSAIRGPLGIRLPRDIEISLLRYANADARIDATAAADALIRRQTQTWIYLRGRRGRCVFAELHPLTGVDGGRRNRGGTGPGGCDDDAVELEEDSRSRDSAVGERNWRRCRISKERQSCAYMYMRSHSGEHPDP
ncbi:hypothetical protein DFH09DRAFT_1103102 [Mycena vulgaris]|nr:hypothetical protein DFH09DRAFT_1103102 [Mycena vulgaris]